MKTKELGQFFTHPEVANFMAQLIHPKDGEHVIDPACGDGEFLHNIYEINPNTHTYGCEIDEHFYYEAKERNPHSNIFLHNGLYSNALFEGESDISNEVPNNFYDTVIANPPFNGLRNKITDVEILSLYEVALKDNKMRPAQSVEILFLERFVNLLKDNGRFCAILPEGILSDQRLAYIRDWLYDKLSIEAIIALPKRGIFANAYVNVVILCAKKKPTEVENKKVFFVRDTKLEDLPFILDYMKRNEIFITEQGGERK